MRYSVVMITAVWALGWVVFATAQTAEELRTKIDGNRSEIQKIESEIKQYEQQLTEVQGEKQTLQSAVNALDVSRKKTSASIQLTQSKISSTQSKIVSLSEQIDDKLTRIQSGKAGLAQSLRSMNAEEDYSLIELLFRTSNLASAWSAVDSLQQFQTVVSGHVDELQDVRQTLETTKDEREGEQRTLEAQKEELDSQKYSLDINRKEKSTLLTQTKSKESEYQKILEQKRTAKEEIEAEISAYEAQLKYVLDPSSLPTAGEGVLLYPLSSVYITQYFGNTSFASTGAYNGQGHNGIDFRAVVGTPVYAAQSGVVMDTGNTDAVAGCYSYGKWVLIKHDNGLATLYGHLSTISVTAGERVVAKQRIGYSGNTGYSTGPHLHFSVFVGSQVRVVRMGDIKTKTNCANARVPVAPTEAYLNPLNYL